MDRLDREIMKTILAEAQSIYSVNEVLNKKGEKANYATVWRHIKKMQKDSLLAVVEARRKNGKADQRKTEILRLTNKGLATLLIEGDLQRKELFSVGMRIFLKTYKKLPISVEPFFTDIFADSLLELKPKVNLKFFDENWFRKVSNITFNKAARKAVKKYQAKFEKEGIWATEKELEESQDQFWSSFIEDLKSAEESENNG